MSSVRALLETGIALSLVRRVGGILFADQGDWWSIDRTSDLSSAATLSILVTQHLAYDKKVLSENEVLSALRFFHKDVARYALKTQIAIDKANKSGDTADRELPVVMLEILENHWVCLGNLKKVFDLVEQCETTLEKITAGLVSSSVTYSHSLCLLPLFLRAYPLESKNGDNSKPKNTN